jgi:hypothetical protein
MDRNSVATMRLQFEPARPSAKPLVIVNAFIERVNDSDSPTDVYHV